ncbi:MAG: hypothetical protein KatS3mg105_3002 [Gemmatales bacterium]|nr:MAG: hypothetical protein KatS3mg105_3002 [Gemmatales bacterium]
MDRYEVPLAVIVHANIPSKDDASTVEIIVLQRSIAHNPESAVGMNELQLPGEPAVIRCVTNTRFIPTA